MSEEAAVVEGEPVVEETPKSLTADEQAEKFLELNRPLLEKFNALPDAQKIAALVKYVRRFGGFPVPPKEPAKQPVEQET